MSDQRPPPKPRFTGIFIPVEILSIENITPLEMILLSWIDALYSEQDGGCYAKNEYLAARLHVEENTIAKAVSKLRKFGLIEDVSFDGRNRVIKATIAKAIEKAQSNAALDLNPKQGWTKIQDRVGQKSIEIDSPIIIESKEEIKEREGAAAPQPPPLALDEVSSKAKKEKKQAPEKKPVREQVFLSDQEHDSLKASHSAEILDAMLDKLDSYKTAHGKVYKSDFAVLKKGGWVHDQIVKNMGKSNGNYQKPANKNDAIKQRQFDEYRKSNPEFGTANSFDFSKE